ncbi:MAG: translation elongation factor Ts [Candidatus Pacebacteria bacterium CG10_big_fil_rev_8_21_14_0_10_56_10]|nr:MAG: translation elongation factor Ts [Candidatus Pacebacteria bacterium CG10_big_fil_rev_8_21_14_0_10_56_10]
MSNFSAADVKQLRHQTGAGVLDCRRALEQADGDMAKAVELVRAKGLARAEKKADRPTNEGYVAAYVHQTGKIAVLVELLSETDFVARNDQFRHLAREIAMQVASMAPTTVDELLAQEYIRDSSQTLEQLVKQTSGTLGEKLAVSRFVRYQVGE